MLGLQREGLVLKLQEVAAENDRLLRQCCNTQVTQGMLCDIALWCAQIKEDGMKTEALAELIDTAANKSGEAWFWAAITCLTKRLLFS